MDLNSLKQVLPSLPRVNPELQEQENDPLRLLQTWAQLCVPSVHSFISEIQRVKYTNTIGNYYTQSWKQNNPTHYELHIPNLKKSALLTGVIIMHSV